MTDYATANPSPALKIALAYFGAWTHKNLDRAVYYIADDIVCDAPGSAHQRRRGLSGVLEPVRADPNRSRMVAAFGNDETALVMYDTTTVAVRSAPCTECVTVKDGKISRSWFVFDRAPFDAVRAPRAKPGSPP